LVRARRLGKFYPRKPHCRDAAYPNWDNAGTNNAHALCGGVVSGNYIAAPSSGTDLHTDTRANFRENEAAIDYGGSTLCAFAGYAALANGAISNCGGIVTRTPFTGRT
jgi:hypothetical protein